MNNLELIAKQTDRNLTKKTLKKQKLIELANSVLYSAKYQHHFEVLLHKLDLTHALAIKSFLEYNLESVFELPGNEIYSSLGNRVTLHIHNLLAGSWHIERQEKIWKFIEHLPIQNLADIGFGVPSLYLKNILSQKLPIHVSLCDLYEAAFDFSKALIPLWEESWDTKVSFLQTDMNKQDFIGPFDLYLFQDSIEHTINPTSYLKKYVSLSPSHSLFLFSLPIGPLIPGHYMTWNTNAEAENWLKSCNLKPISYTNVFVNLEVDLFAQDLGSEFNNYMVLCEKY